MTIPRAGVQVARRFRSRTAAVLAVLLWMLAALVAVLTAAGGSSGLTGLPVALAVAFAGCWLFWFPSVTFDDDAVTLINPARTVRVPWAALIGTETRFALRLVTPGGSYAAFAAFAALAPGAVAIRRTGPNDAGRRIGRCAARRRRR